MRTFLPNTRPNRRLACGLFGVCLGWSALNVVAYFVPAVDMALTRWLV